MAVRYVLSMAGIAAFLQFFFMAPCSAAAVSDTIAARGGGDFSAVSAGCDNPVVVSSLIITNSVCGDSTGVVLLNLAGGNSGCSFAWQPGVSNSNVAFGLKAAAYKIHITRINNPECTLDTTIIVNNSNGPDVDVVEIQPSNCLASNGKVTLTPLSWNYVWSNGETGPVNGDLVSGCHIVTATDPGSGCYSVMRVCVPNKNPLQSTFEIIEPAKCGLAAGVGEVKVAGGSGQYNYSFGNGPVISGLAPGTYTFFIVDNVSGCLDTVAATMTAGPLKGDVVVKPFNIKCPGGGTGNVQFEVIPGSNFKVPFTFTLRDQNGVSQSPGSLAAGTYFLQIADADGCQLSPDTFQILAPPAFAAQTTVQPVSCAAGGQIQLALSGGNGRYIVDWADLPGFDNPRNRLNINAGYYSATVYDSLFCAYPVGPVFVPDYCNVPDTFTLVVAVNSTDTFCLTPPPGVNPASLSYAVVGPNNPIYGDWSLDPDGCLVYEAGPVAKFGVDPICVAMLSGVPGLSDTICIIVNITTATPEKDSVYFAVQAGNSGTACGYVPPNFNNRVVSLMNGSGLSGTSDAFGAYTIDAHTACITFNSYGPTGYNVDEIRVGVCDTVLRQCRLICYFPTVLSPNDCLDGIGLPDSLLLSTADCDAGATVCVPIPFEQIFDYAILDNGAAYSGGLFASCDQQAAVAYILPLNGGPYQLAEWTVGNQVFSGFFTDRYELLGLMNQYDPLPGWTLEHDSVFIGGKLLQTYGSLKVISAQDQSVEASPQQKNVPFGTVMRFATGQHTIVFRRVQTGCLDTMRVIVACTNCPPVHNYVPDVQGNIVWNLVQCADTAFCTNMLTQKLSEYSVTEKGQPFTSFSFCGNYAALRLDTGFHQLHILHTVSLCEYDLKVILNCSANPNDLTRAVRDEVVTFKNTPVDVRLLDNDIIRGIVANKGGLEKVELLGDPPHGSVFLDDIFGQAVYTPDDGYCGADSFPYQITDTAGQRSSTLVRVTIVCDKILIYNGISPNNDGKNDVWHIPGIEQFPANEVRIFNRWGNLVFQRKAYTNQNAWDGTWNGKDLPDGVYFYLIDLGDGSKALSGYLQLMR